MTPTTDEVSVTTMRALAAFAVAMLLPSVASAAEEEWVLSAEPGVMLRSLSSGLEFGVGGQLSGWYGLSDSGWVVLSGGAYQGLAEEAPGDALVGEFSAGLVLALDVLRTIPFLEVTGGLNLIDGDISPLLRVGVGADYLVSPSFSVGGIAQYRLLFGSGATEDIPVTVALRLSWRGEL